MAVDGWELIETYYSTVEFSMIYAGILVLCKVPQEYRNNVAVGFQIFVFCLSPCDSESLHNSKLCFAGFRHVFLSQPLLREDLSTTYLTTMFQIETTEWYCSSFKLCNKLFCLDSSQVGRTLSYNWIHTVYSKHLRCYTGWGYDSWMPLLGIWLLVVSQKATMGFWCGCWFQETSRNKDVKSFDSCGTCGKIWILWVKVQRWNTSAKERILVTCSGMKENKGASFTSGACTYCTVVFFSYWDHKIPVETMIMKCLWCVNGIRLRWLRSSFSKFFKQIVILKHKKGWRQNQMRQTLSFEYPALMEIRISKLSRWPVRGWEAETGFSFPRALWPQESGMANISQLPLLEHGAQGDMIVVFPSPLVFGCHFSVTSSGTVSRKEPSKWLSMRLASSGSADSCLSLGGRYDWMCQQNSLPGYCTQILILIHLLTHCSVDWDLVFRNLGSEIKWRASFQQLENDYCIQLDVMSHCNCILQVAWGTSNEPVNQLMRIITKWLTGLLNV